MTIFYSKVLYINVWYFIWQIELDKRKLMQQSSSLFFKINKSNQVQYLSPLVEHQIVVVLKHIISWDTATCGVPNDGHAVSSFKVRLYQFVVTAITKHHASQLQAFYSQQVDRLLTFVGEAKILRIPSGRYEKKFIELTPEWNLNHLIWKIVYNFKLSPQWHKIFRITFLTVFLT